MFYETGEHQGKYDNSYMGYAAATGDFDGDSKDGELNTMLQRFNKIKSNLLNAI